MGDVLATSITMMNKYATPIGTYTPSSDMDNGDSDAVLITSTWTLDYAQLTYLCSVEPTCVGFNSVGQLKNSTAGLVATAGVTFYTKQ